MKRILLLIATLYTINGYSQSMISTGISWNRGYTGVYIGLSNLNDANFRFSGSLTLGTGIQSLWNDGIAQGPFAMGRFTTDYVFPAHTVSPYIGIGAMAFINLPQSATISGALLDGHIGSIIHLSDRVKLNFQGGVFYGWIRYNFKSYFSEPYTDTEYMPFASIGVLFPILSSARY